MTPEEERAEAARRLKALEDAVAAYPPAPELETTLEEIERRLRVLEWYAATFREEEEDK